MRTRGQLLVELAVALPFLLFTILGAVDAGFLLIAKAHQDRAASVVVEWAAGHPGEPWASVADRELHGCDVTVSSERDLYRTLATCQHHSIFLPALAVTMTSSESAAGFPTPTPAASPSSSSTARPGEPDGSGSAP